MTGHFVTVEVNGGKIYFCDNHTKQPMPAAASARMMQACISAHLVIKRRDPMFVESRIETELVPGDGYYLLLRITEEIIYDVPKYNKTLTIGTVKFKSKDDYTKFVEGLKI